MLENIPLSLKFTTQLSFDVAADADIVCDKAAVL
jgi:hypothetical protein